MNCLAWHPFSNILLSCSHDKLVKVWDVSKQKLVYDQEGHFEPVYCIASHPDGSLFVSADLKGVVLMWDLRIGKQIADFKGHVKGIRDIDFSSNGKEFVTAGEDNTIRIWDLRRMKHDKILAHRGVVTVSKFLEGNCIMTGSVDGSVRFWDYREKKLLQQARTPTMARITSAVWVDKKLYVGALDKTCKLFEEVIDDLN